LRACSTRFEPELLSSEESITLIYEICQKAVSSNQMMRGLSQHVGLMGLLGRIVNHSVLHDYFDQTQVCLSNVASETYNVYCQPRKCDQASTNKKNAAQAQQRRNQSVNL
jgi:hypothetical protein